MKRINISYLSWAALLGAVGVWVGVIFFALQISTEESEHALRVADAEQTSVRQAAAIRLHALARDTKDSREALYAMADQDVIEILHEIEAVARDTGIPVGIRQALTVPTSDSPSSLNSAAFIVEVEGTFAEVTHAVALLETLPIPSTANELQFERLIGDGSKRSSAPLWRMVARMQFFTTADIVS